MSLDENKQAILLLSARFSGVRRGDPAPLTPTEYGRFAGWLNENGYQPKDLLDDSEAVTRSWSDPKGKITADRLKFLLGRGMAMGLALENWNSAGIWILTRSDSDYPGRLKRILRMDAPAVLFGVGERNLLDAGGLAMVGSRAINSSDQAYAQQIARCASNEGLNVVSGGAKGVDETAMLAALEVDGTAVGILANGLTTAALSGKWRSHIKSHRLCLVSPYYPDAPFNTGTAMGRNKYIYCLADHGLVVRSDKGKGGTWAGATEALKKELAGVFVKPDSDAAGNAALIHLGASPLPAPSADAAPDDTWLRRALEGSAGSDAVSQESPSSPVAEPELEAADADGTSSERPGVAKPPSPVSPVPLEPPDLFFGCFVEWLKRFLEANGEVTLTELKELHPDLTPKQITDWLARAVAEGLVERLGKRHRYSLKEARATQQTFFDSEDSQR